MKISVIGAGYVGLVTGTCFAESGNDVICMDSDRKKIEMLGAGKVPIYEPGLKELMERNVANGRLSFTSNMAQAVKGSTVVFIAVGTPPDGNGAADLTYVLQAAAGIGTHMNGYKVIVNKSTVPVGTAEKVKALIAGRTGRKFDVVSNPEFLKEGAAIDDFMRPDRVVIGTESRKAGNIVRELYAPFIRKGDRVLVMDLRSAEMTKYASNAMLATKISFINEMANVCARLGADIESVRRGMGYDRRIGFDFLFPGVGYGGSCFPKDVRALVQAAREHGMETRILKAVEAVNECQKSVLCDMIVSHFANGGGRRKNGNGRALTGRTIALWGLSFKPRTDDMRQAPSLVIIDSLLKAGAVVRAHDPVAMEQARSIFEDRITLAADGYEAVRGADALAVVTEWNEFRMPDFPRLHKLMKGPVIFDGRNLYNRTELERMGFTYYGIGRAQRRML